MTLPPESEGTEGDLQISPPARSVLEAQPEAVLGALENVSEDPHSKNSGEWLEQYFVACYGVLPEDHPLTQYVAALNAKFPKTTARFKILPGWKEINAVALPNNTILLSQGLIEFCEFEEELMFVLGHERTHLKRHFQERKTKKRTGTKSIIQDAIKEIGHNRFAEYEADLRSVVEEMDASGINPFGGKYFLERLAFELPGGDKKDLAHGGSLDRMLNIATVTRLFDLKELSMDLTPWKADETFPKECRDLRKGIPTRPSHTKYPREHTEYTIDHLRDLEKDALLLVHDIHRQREVTTAYAKEYPQNLGARLDAGFAEDMFSVAMKNIDAMIKDLFPAFTAKEMEIFKIFVLHFGSGAPVLDDPEWSRGCFDALESENDMGKLAEICSVENFRKTGFFAVGDPREWFRAILVHACDMGIFGEATQFDRRKYIDFARTFFRQIEAINLSFGTETFDEKQTSAIIAQAAEPSIGPNGMAALTAALQKEFGTDAETVPREELQLDEYILGILQGHPRLPLEQSTHENETDAQGKAAYAYMQSKTAEFMVEHNFPTGKDLAQYLDRFYERRGSQLDSKTKYILKDLFFEIWRLIEPGIENKFFIGVFLSLIIEDDAGLEQNILFEIERDADVDLEHTTRSFFDLPYRKEVWGIGEKESEEVLQDLQGGFIRDYLLPYFERLPSKEALLAEIKKYESYGLNFSRRSGFVTYQGIHCQSFLKEIFSQHIFDSEHLSTTDIELLLILSHLLTDVSRAMRLQSFLMKKMTGGTSFEEELDILFRNKRTKSCGDSGLRDEWIETKTHSPEKLQLIEDTARSSVEAWTGGGDFTKSLGELSLLDVIEGFWTQKLAILMGLLGTGESDEAIKKELLKRRRLSTGENMGKEIADELGNCDIVLSGLFGLNAEARYGVLRMLLMGKNGIFRSKNGRKKFLKEFLETSLSSEAEESDLENLLRDIVPVLGEIDDPELFFFAFLPMLYQRFAPYPKRITPWSELLEKMQIPEIDEIMEEYGKIVKDERNVELEDVSYHYASVREVHTFLDEKFLPPNEAQEELKLSPLNFIVEVAKNLGAVGVRFLQLLGQYMEVPKQYESSFSGIYDQMRGQSKLAAHRLVKREWPEFAQTIKSLHPRIGGGSLMTVYEVETKDGNREVLKVLNPNVQFHLDRVFGFLEKFIDALVAQFGSAYEPVRFALDDIREWISRDVSLDHFLADDQRFAIKNHGFRTEHGPESYHIGVPKTFEPENRYFIREEFIPGKNLTQWDELVAEGHDMKKIVSLLCKNYMAQIADGQAHADIHVGNIRITEDRTCFILDRAGYLRFDEDDKALFMAFASGDAAALRTVASAYFKKCNDAENLEATVARALDGTTSPQDVLLHLKREQVKVPLKITLLMKNLSVLENFSKKAGFTGLQEALAG